VPEVMGGCGSQNRDRIAAVRLQTTCALRPKR
jgi:hypothetical protein